MLPQLGQELQQRVNLNETSTFRELCDWLSSLARAWPLLRWRLRGYGFTDTASSTLRDLYPAPSQSDRVRSIYLPALILGSTVAFIVGESVGYGDAPYYAEDIANGSFIEPGHLLWRPLGGLVYWIAQAAGYPGDALWVIQGLSLMASVASVGAMFLFISRWCSQTAALLGAALFAFSHGFWYYASSGCSYSLSVFFSIFAFILAAPNTSQTTQSSWRGLLSGVFGGLASLAWLIQGANFPALLLANILFLKTARRQHVLQILVAMVPFLAGYWITVGLPLTGIYFYQAAASPGPGFLAWLSRSGHGIHTTFGIHQLMRLVLGWGQSMIALGDLGMTMKIWLLDGVPLALSHVSPGLFLLTVFYFFVAGGTWVIVRRKGPMLTGPQRRILLVAICSLVANAGFALYWDATSLERYFPSVPFLVLGACVALERLRLQRNQNGASQIRGMAVGVVAIGALILINWFGTFYPALAGNSVKRQWLSEIQRRLDKDDLLIVLGKHDVTDPHNRAMPKVLSLSIQITMMSNPEEWKPFTTRWVRETWAQGGRVLIGESVLGLGSRPRDGWSFTEHPVPSPKDLDAFFAPLKGELLFSVSGERVWVAKPLS
jgi:hypothetical protein